MIPFRARTHLLVLGALLLGLAPRSADAGTLVLRHVTLFDSLEARPLPDRTVVVEDERIVAVGPAGEVAVPEGAEVIEGDGRLLVPGFIDVHHHLGMVLADSLSPGGGPVLRLAMEPDSIRAYERRWAAAYLPWGVTTVRDAGSPDAVAPLLQALMEPDPARPDFFPCGGALVTTEEGRTPYQGHHAVADSADAVRTVGRYHDLGYRFVKLYWRLQEPEFAAAYREARRVGMIPFAHIDFNVTSIPWALELGVRQFAHAYTLIKAVLDPEEQYAILRDRGATYADLGADGLFFLQTMIWFDEVGADDPRLTALVDRLAAAGARVTPTLHVFAHPLGLTWFPFTPEVPFHDTSGFPLERMETARAGYRQLAELTRRLHEAGVALTLGTDTADPGRAALSEMILLEEAGIPMNEVLRIATVNGAASLGLDDRGVIEPGRLADLVLFERDPLRNPRNLLGSRTVFRLGVVAAP